MPKCTELRAARPANDNARTNVIDLGAVRESRQRARNASIFSADRREQAGRRVLKLVEGALDCYRSAARARDVEGDDASADVLCEAADRAVRVATETIEDLATM